MPFCPSCGLEAESWEEISSHMLNRTDSSHVMWLNRNVSINRMNARELSAALYDLFRIESSLSDWVLKKVVQRIYSGPHPFIAAMQRPTREVLLGYVYEHRHFLKNWVQVLSSVIYRTDDERVIKYELENISTEYVGNNGPSHFELLLRMGEALGARREDILSAQPLPGTANAIAKWRRIAAERSWVETMAAMHSLEYIADKRVRQAGAKVHYFNVEILSSEIYPEEVKQFLKEGYEADSYHAADAMRLVEEHAKGGMVQKVQMAVLDSLDAVSTYLNARLERTRMLKGRA